MPGLPGGISRWTAVLFLTLLPLAVLMALVYIAHGASILDALPSHPDDFRNWLVARNFCDVGFESGYFVHNEIPARWTMTPYAADGPWYAMLFGIAAKVGGWQLHSGVLYNMFFFCALLLFFGARAQTDTRGLVWLALFVAFSPSVYLAALSTAYTLSYLALSIPLAILFEKMFNRLGQGRPMGWLRPGVFAAVFAAAVYKVDWAVLFFPVLLMGRKGLREWLGWGSAALALCALSAVVMLLAGAPVGSSTSTLSFWSAQHPLQALLETMLALVIHNINAYRGGQVSSQELLVQAQGLLVLAAFVVPGFRLAGLAPSMARSMAWFNLFNIASVFVLVNTMYVPYAGISEKYITSHLFVSVMAQYRYFNRKVLAVLMGLCVASFLLFSCDANRKTICYFNALPLAKAAAFAEQARETFHYTPGANRWYNTVLDLTGQYPPEILALPSGLGYSVVYDPKRVALPLKSRYVIHDGSPAAAEIITASRLKFLMATHFGSIYENLDSPGPEGNLP